MLIKNGVQLGDYVGIFMKRSIDTVVSMVAILKAGALYVPIDPIIRKVEYSTLFKIAKRKLY